MKTGTKETKGFSLLEILVVISLIGVLASVVLVNLSSSKQRAKDMAALAMMDSVRPEVYRCLLKDITGIQLENPVYQRFTSGISTLCSNGGGPISGIDNWPSMPGITQEWTYGQASSAFSFRFCAPGYASNNPPPLINTSSDYLEGTYGGDRSRSAFCYMLCNRTCGNADNNKWIWCTEISCKKKGF